MRCPVITVIGATGTGKSQLAVDLALALNGEVINADAMQMYSGLPIVTNKISEEERCGVPHHLLGFLDTRDVSRVGKFVQSAEKAIEDIQKRKRLPIIVGGTHYYVQSLLFPHSIPASEEDGAEGNAYPFPSEEGDLAVKYPILDAETPVLYEALKSVDPVMAARWHPNDHRKIRRSLEIYYSTGGTKTASEIYAAQRAEKHENVSAEFGPSTSKYRNLVFWVHAETETLRERLDTRVDKMIDSGIWEEIEEMERLYESLGGSSVVDLNCGIWQSIGFKEFLEYLKMRKTEQSSPEDMDSLRKKAISEMKTATRQYARRQERWIRIKFVNALQAENAGNDQASHMYLMDSTDVAKYKTNVTKPAIDIAKDFLAGAPLPEPASLSPLAEACLKPKRDFDMSQRPELWVRRTCEVCDVLTLNDAEWETHMKSGKHKKRIQSAKKRKEVEEFLRRRKENEGNQNLETQTPKEQESPSG
ncbi:IPP transferase-domain-containing protein [Geopyxis carbonaria]|nr:IPP transferase-domain-containing protein [Geopyxis carbonaria]